jgi:hypothetical protein
LWSTTPAESRFILVQVELDISLYLSISSYFGYFIVYRYGLELFTFSMYGSSLKSWILNLTTLKPYLLYFITLINSLKIHLLFLLKWCTLIKESIYEIGENRTKKKDVLWKSVWLCIRVPLHHKYIHACTWHEHSFCSVIPSQRYNVGARAVLNVIIIFFFAVFKTSR